MATALIIFHQPALDGYSTPGSRDDLSLGSPVTCANVNDTGVTTWLWQMVEQPSGSAAVLATPTGQTASFTPDVAGTYLIKLSVNGGASTDQKGAAVRTAKLNYRIPAATESLEFDGYRGWSTAVNAALKIIDDGYNTQAPPSFQTVYTASVPSSFVLNGANGAFIVKDASSPLGTNLLEIASNNGAVKYFTVGSTASSFSTPVDVGNNKITSLATPTASSDAATKAYVDAATSGTGTLQTAYDASNPATINIASNGPVIITDGYTPVNTNLFEIDAYGVSTKYIKMDRTGAFFQRASGSPNLQTTPNTGTTPAIWGSSASDIYIGGSTGGTKAAHSTGNGTWTSITDPGPSNEAITALWTNTAGSIFAGTNNSNVNGGIYKSTNSGTTWTQQFSNQITALWGLDSTHLYAAGGGGTSGVFYSSNGGGSWSVGGSVSHFINSIWASSSSMILVGTGFARDGYIYRSTNAGASFTQVLATSSLAGHADGNITSIWGTDSTHIFAAGQDGIVVFSSDNGVTWSLQTTGILAGTDILSIFGTGPHDVYIATNGTGTDTIYHSRGDGIWNSISNVGQTTGQRTIWASGPNNVYVTTNGQNKVIHLGPTGGDITVDGNIYTNSILASAATNLTINNPVQINSIVVDPNFTTPTSGQALVYNGSKFVPQTVSSLSGLTTNYLPIATSSTSLGNSDYYGENLTGGFPGMLSTNDKIAGLRAYGGANGAVTTFVSSGDGYFPNGLNINLAGTNSPALEFKSSLGSPRRIKLKQTSTLTGDAREFQINCDPSGSDVGTLAVGDSHIYASVDTTLTQSLTVDGYTHVFGDLTVDGYFTLDGYLIDPHGALNGQVLEYNGTAFVPTNPAGGPPISDSGNTQLTTTFATDIISYVTPTDGDYVMYVYYRITTAPTNLFLTMNWTDPSGSQFTTLLPNTSQPIGSYNIAPVYFNATAGTTIRMQATAGTANNAFVSASLMTLAPSAGAIAPIQENANVFDSLMTTTSATTVTTYTPSANGNFVVYVYYRVANATTNVTLSLAWTDMGGSQSLTVIGPASSKTTGSYSVSAIYIQCAAGGAITLTATAGTANNLHVSSTIMRI